MGVDQEGESEETVMINGPFEYFAPRSVGEAVSLLRRQGSNAKLIAGGQSLVPLMNLGLLAPKRIIDLTKIKGGALSGIGLGKGAMTIGSMTTHYELEKSALVRKHFPILHEAAGSIADVQIRNRGTVGGSVCHADPAGDYNAPLVALNAEFLAVNSRRKTRRIGADRFFQDVFTTSLKSDELLTAIRLRKREQRNVGSAYLKHKFIEGGFAIVAAAAVVSTDGQMTCNQAKVVLSGVGSRPVVVDAIEEELRGKTIDENAIERAGVLASEAIPDPLSDIHASADYRREMASVFAKRALNLAVARSRGREP